jgi:predicted AAA+ superfamily ATPase
VSGRPGDLIDQLFRGELHSGAYERFGAALAGHIVSGGYPAALVRRTDRRRREWYRAYIETLVQRDVQELARISRLDVIPRLLELAAGQTARLFNISELASPFQLSRPTIRDYVTLLERIFLLEQLPPWHSNRLSRLVKTPKLHLGDTGLAASLLGVDAVALGRDGGLLGQLLESFVYQELRRQASWSEQAIRFYHLRDRDGYEVDMILEREGRDIVGIEVKSAATVTGRDFQALRRLKSALGERFCAGVVLYDGERAVRFEDKLLAVPIAALWGRA